MRRLLVVAFIVLAQTATSAACDCMATPADKVAGTYRAITALLCFMPLIMLFGLYRWLGHRLHETEAAPAPLPAPGNGSASA